MSEASAIPARPLPRRGGSNPSSRARTAALALKRGRPRRAASTSRSITRPPGPLPSKVSGSIPCLMATFRARGLIPAPDPADAKCDGSEFVTSVAGPGGFAGPGLEEGSGSAAGGAEGSAPAGRRSSAFSPSSPMAAAFAKTGASSSASQNSARTFRSRGFEIEAGFVGFNDQGVPFGNLMPNFNFPFRKNATLDRLSLARHNDRCGHGYLLLLLGL